jgi:putative restriction endonuclease
VNITDFFSDVLGAKLTNHVWSWGAVNAIRNRFYLRVWDDEIESDRRGRRVAISWKDSETPSRGQQERRQHIEEIRGGAQALGVQCHAVSTQSGVRRRIKTFDAEHLLIFGRLEEDDTTVWARITGELPVSDLQESVPGPGGLKEDIKEILSRPRLGSTEKDALLKARLGQGRFRAGTLSLWGNRCAVTGCAVLEAVRASHIKGLAQVDRHGTSRSEKRIAIGSSPGCVVRCRPHFFR